MRGHALAGLIVTLVASTNLPVAHAQATSSKVLGRPLLTCYSPEELGAHSQTWQLLQDASGVLFAANGIGVLEFDGATWSLVTPPRQLVRSLAIADDGRLYAGSTGDFGYLEPDSVGRSQYVSLLEHVPEEDRQFSYVWTVHATPDGIVFQAIERIFRFRPNAGSWQVEKWIPDGRFSHAFWVQDTLFVHQGGVGLMKMVGDSLQLLPGGDQFLNDRIQVFMPLWEGPERNGGGTLLVGTFSRGLFLYDGSSFRPWRVPASDFLRLRTPYKAVELPNRDLAVATLSDGVVILTREGQVVQHLQSESGLPSTGVTSIGVDNQGGLWMGPENGICRTEIPSPLTIVDAATGLQDQPIDLMRHNGVLYVATTRGAYFFHPDTGRLQRVENLGVGGQQTWKFLQIETDLLVGTAGGVYKINGHRATPVRLGDAVLSYATFWLHRSRQDTNRVFVGLFDGLASLYRRPDGTYVDEGRIPGIEGMSPQIIEPEPGVLWIARDAGGVLRLTLDARSPHPTHVDTLGAEKGLSNEGESYLFPTSAGLFTVSSVGVYGFNAASDRFEPVELFDDIGRKANHAYAIHEDADQNLWVNFGRETAFLRRQPNGSFRKEITAFLQFFDNPAFLVYPDEDGSVWFVTSKGLIRYDPASERNYDHHYAAMIRRVTAGADDIYAGGGASRAAAKGAAAVMQLGPQRNSLRFAFSAPALVRPHETQYQSRLVGFDAEWSGWSKESFRTYTNLPQGAYTFRVRARNIFGVESGEATYAFAILPPWYRTWFAYVVYFLAATGGMWMFVRVRTRHLHARSRELEEVVDQRTHELREQKENVEVLSRIGRDITATLEFETIFNRLYENVNQLMDATVFGVGVYDPEREVIDYRLAVERGKRYAPYTRDMKDKNQLPVWCIENRAPILIHDFDSEHSKFVASTNAEEKLLEDGTLSEKPRSLIYLPLIAKDRVLGVLTVQSFTREAYSAYDVSVIETLAAYASIALDNAYAYRRLNETLEHLQAVQLQLIHQEKLASLGRMTAGIAHEIKNPLNFVNNFAAVSVELVAEIEQDLEALHGQIDASTEASLMALFADLRLNAAKIEEHGQRANGIVKSMLEHSRGTTAERRMVQINPLINEYVNLAFHGMRAEDPEFSCTIERALDEAAGTCEVAPQEIGRVLINLLNNAFHAVWERRGRSGPEYVATIRVATEAADENVAITIWDNGGGIPSDIRHHIFEPFFTTKSAGEGTGLGLSLSYDIITQGHGGTIDVRCEEGETTAFIVTLPRSSRLSLPLESGTAAA